MFDSWFLLAKRDLVPGQDTEAWTLGPFNSTSPIERGRAVVFSGLSVGAVTLHKIKGARLTLSHTVFLSHITV